MNVFAALRFPLPAYTPLVAPLLNLAALTGDELARLLGPEAAQKLLPDVSRARLEGKSYRGPPLEATCDLEALPERVWGATAGDTRRIRALQEEFAALGFTALGAYYAPGVLGARHSLIWLGDGDTAACLRWSETPHTFAEAPFVELLTLLRDRASGFAAVLTTTSQLPPVPAPSDTVAERSLPGAGAHEARETHRAELSRHGRGVKLATFGDWARAWQTLRDLNFAAWSRRGAVIEDKP